MRVKFKCDEILYRSIYFLNVSAAITLKQVLAYVRDGNPLCPIREEGSHICQKGVH